MTFKQDIAGKQKQWATSNRRRNQPFYQGYSPELLISKWPNLYSGGSICVLCHPASAFGCTMGSPSFGVSKTLTPEDNILHPRPVHRFLQGQPPLHCWEVLMRGWCFQCLCSQLGHLGAQHWFCFKIKRLNIYRWSAHLPAQLGH